MEQFFRKNKEHIINWSVFIVGTLTCCFTRLTFNMFFCAFIFPACFLFFIRRIKKPYIALPSMYGGAVLGCTISLWKIVDLDAIGIQIGIAFLLSLLVTIPYILDKLIYSRWYKKHPFVLSFLFPLTWITIDVILGLTPIGYITSISYALSQLIKVVSIINFLGINFLSFAIIYFNTSIANIAIDIKKNIKTIITNCSILLFCLVYSGVFNTIPPVYTDSLKIMTGYSTNDNQDGYNRRKLSLQDNKEWLDIDINKAKQNNVQMLVYPEQAFYLYSDDNEDIDFKQYLVQKAIKDNLYIVTGIDLAPNKDSNKNLKNLAWVAMPNGCVIEYTKNNLVPIEEEGYDVGNGKVISFDIPNKAKVGVVICMDLEFPSYISQLGRLGCDIVIAPSWDWQTIHSSHTISTAYRAIENGFNFVRCTEDGYSLAIDYKGNIICQYYNNSSYKQKNHNNHVFDLPTKGIKTPYSYLAPGIDYIYPITLISLLIVFGIIDNRIKENKSKEKKV